MAHDEDDGAWQFLCGTTTEAADGRLVHVSHLLEREPRLIDFADLPRGWVAWSDDDGAWHRELAEPEA